MAFSGAGAEKTDADELLAENQGKGDYMDKIFTVATRDISDTAPVLAQAGSMFIAVLEPFIRNDPLQPPPLDWAQKAEAAKHMAERAVKMAREVVSFINLASQLDDASQKQALAEALRCEEAHKKQPPIHQHGVASPQPQQQPLQQQADDAPSPISDMFEVEEEGDDDFSGASFDSTTFDTTMEPVVEALD